LENEKIHGDSARIFDLYYDIIEISKKLRDFDAISMFQTELIQFFQTNKFKLPEIEKLRFNLEQQADLLLNDHLFEMAAKMYEKCEILSLLLENFSKEEIINVENFRNKKDKCLQNLTDS